MYSNEEYLSFICTNSSPKGSLSPENQPQKYNLFWDEVWVFSQESYYKEQEKQENNNCTRCRHVAHVFNSSALQGNSRQYETESVLCLEHLLWEIFLGKNRNMGHYGWCAISIVVQFQATSLEKIGY